MVKITSEVLAEKIDALHARFDDVCEYRIKPLEDESKKNTEFRQKAYGVIGLLTICAGAITAFGMWMINRVWK